MNKKELEKRAKRLTKGLSKKGLKILLEKVRGEIGDWMIVEKTLEAILCKKNTKN